MSKSPEEMVDAIIHAGVKGMKWGVRKSKKETGNSRLKGAVLDRNQVNINTIERMRSGKLTKTEKVLTTPAKILYGKRYAERLAKSEKSYKDQRARIESGKTTLSDKLETLNSVTLVDLLVSRTAYTK